MNTKTLVFGTLGAAIISILLVGCGDDDADDAVRSGGQAGMSSVDAEGPAPGADGDKALRDQSGGATDPGSSPPPESTSLERKIVFHATLDMHADNVQGSFNEVGRIARTSGGFIEKSSLFTRKDNDGEEQPYATLSLRVPSSQYQDVLNSLRTLSGIEVKREESGANEVTEQYTDLQSRLRNLERSEAQYLALLERATTIQEILTVQERIDGVRLQIERIQGQLKVLDDLTELATINVTLEPMPPAKVEPVKEGPKSPVAAFSETWDVSVEAARYLLAIAAGLTAVAIWLAVPVGLVLLVSRYGRRRRPDAVS